MRDHVLGIRAVNGTGETIHSGGRVLKNVTGLDLCKLLTGSHGTLGGDHRGHAEGAARAGGDRHAGAARPGRRRRGGGAVGRRWARRTASPPPPGCRRSGGAGARRWAGSAAAVALVRIEDFAPSVAYRTDRLRDDLAEFGAAEILDDDASRAVWRAVRDARPAGGRAGGRGLARLGAPLGRTGGARGRSRPFGAALVPRLGRRPGLDRRPGAETAHTGGERAAARGAGGTWTLLRAPEALRAAWT